MNHQNAPRTWKWRAIGKLMRTVRHLNLSRSDLVVDIAHVESATPLHLAARKGNYALVQWLLQNQADASLKLKNRMGCTPIDIARVCGPHHEVGGLIGSAICVDSVDSQSATRQRRPSIERVARSGATAIEMQFEMWLLPVAEMLKLSELRPHQELRAEGKLVRWNASMRGVFFLSHQWTAFNRPDHSTTQLRTVQRLLTRMLQGELPTTGPSFTDAIRFSSKVKVTSQEWQKLAPHAFVWMDYISVRKATHMLASYHIPHDTFMSVLILCKPTPRSPAVLLACAGAPSGDLHRVVCYE